MATYLRRNGVLPACEPCRKAKHSCDHQNPVCGRCQRKNRPQECFYHPAPLSGSINISGDASATGSKRIRRSDDSPVSSHRQLKPIESPGGHRGLSNPSPSSLRSNSSVYTHVPSPEAARIAGDMPQGYLGPTSYSAVLRENQLVDGNREDSPTAEIQGYPNPQPPPTSQCDLESPRHIEEGVAVLDLMPSFELCHRLLNRHFVIGDSLLHEQSTKRCHDSMWATYRSALRTLRRRHLLQAMSQDLCKTAMSVSSYLSPLISQLHMALL